MYRFPSGDAKKWLVTGIALALLAFVVVWLGFPRSSPQSALDFEACVEQAEAGTPSNDGPGASMTNCSAKFAGRRKPGGGYRYYDFMQDRNFDIAGPNPTAEERKQIDREYMGFLDAQRREMISAELMKRQNEQLRTDLENAHQPVGPPMVLMPRNPASSAAKRPAERSKSARCQDVSLTCGWAKFSAVVKNAFASSPRTKP
jgi:hypothetical protein